VLADGEDVAVRIFEPGYFAAVGGGPDAEVLILGEGNLFRGDAAVAEPGGDGCEGGDDGAERYSVPGGMQSTARNGCATGTLGVDEFAAF